MGSLILCHRKKAEQPFRIAGVYYRIYTIEELCYGICTNLYLLDYSLMSEQLCEWLEDELELYALADGLREQMKNHVSLEKFVLYILESVSIYTEAELMSVRSVLDQLKDQKEVERQKFKADDLYKNGELEASILAYKTILSGKRDETVDARFYGNIYACLGAAYGNLFLYREAAKMYATAFQICDDMTMLRGYLYACRSYMSAEEYHLLLSGNDLYKVTDKEIQKIMQEVAQKEFPAPSMKLVEEWRRQYRKDLG